VQFIDTHTHLYLPEFDDDRDEAVKRALENDVGILLMPNIDVHSIGPMTSAEERYPGICYSMIGLHPTSVKGDYQSQLDIIEENAGARRFIAVGEIGIDLYRDKTFIGEQIIAFRRQIGLGLKYNLPVVIHTRESFRIVFDVLNEFAGETIKGVFHAFTGDIPEAEKVISLGYKIGLGGIVTFKNSRLDSVVREVGIDHVVFETDSPYLAPVPHRGNRNESSYIPIINRRISEILNIDYDKVANKVLKNSIELFNLRVNE
jgi:TatD DNase family protein